MTVTEDGYDEYSYVYRAEITINTRMVHAIREYFVKQHTSAQDSKYGITWGIKYVEIAETETEGFIAISPKNKITYTFYSKVKP
jgi:hypothetical protein